MHPVWIDGLFRMAAIGYRGLGL